MFAPSLQHIKTYTYCYFNIVRFSSSKLKVVFKFNTTAHEVRQRARCHKCGVKGNNTYKIVLKGASGVVMDGAGIAMG